MLRLLGLGGVLVVVAHILETLTQQTAGDLPQGEMAARQDRGHRHPFRIEFQQCRTRDRARVDTRHITLQFDDPAHDCGEGSGFRGHQDTSLPTTRRTGGRARRRRLASGTLRSWCRYPFGSITWLRFRPTRRPMSTSTRIAAERSRSANFAAHRSMAAMTSGGILAWTSGSRPLARRPRLGGRTGVVCSVVPEFRVFMWRVSLP